MAIRAESRLEEVAGLASAVLRATSLDQAMQRFLAEACRFFGADYGLFIYCTHERELIHLESRGLTWLPDSEIIKNLGAPKQSGRSLAPQLVKKCKVLSTGLAISETSDQIKNHIDRKGRDRLIFHRFFAERFASYIAVPLDRGANVFGEITLGYGSNYTLSSIERSILDLLAIFATAVIKATDKDVEVRAGLDILEAILQFGPAERTSSLAPILSKIVTLVGGCGAHVRTIRYNVDSELEAELLDGTGEYYAWAASHKRVITISPNHPLFPAPNSQGAVITSADAENNRSPISLESRDNPLSSIPLSVWDQTRSILVFPLVPPLQGSTGAYLELHSKELLLETDNRVAILGTTLRALGKTIHIAEAEKTKALLRDTLRKQLALLRDICRLIVNENSFLLYKYRVVEKCCAALSCELVTIFLYDRARSMLYGAEWYPRHEGLDAFEETYARNNTAKGITGRVLDCREGEAILVNDPRVIRREAVQAHLKLLNCLPSSKINNQEDSSPVAHLLAVPIIGENGKVFGALRVINKKRLPLEEGSPQQLDAAGFSQDDEELCKTIASIIAQSLAAERRANKLRILHLLGASVAKAETEETIAESVVRIVVEDLGYSASSFRLPRGERLAPFASRGFKTPTLDSILLKRDQGLAGKAIAVGETIVALDVTSDDPNLNQGFENREWAKIEGLKSACCVPIKDDTGKQSYGVFVVYMRGQSYEFLEYERQLMETVATVASVALDKIRWSRMLAENEDCLQRLVEFVEILQLSHSRTELIETGLPEVLRILQADAGLFLKFTNIGGQIASNITLSLSAPSTLDFPSSILESTLLKGQTSFKFSNSQEATPWLAEGFKRGVALNIDSESESLGIIIVLEKHDRSVTISEDLRQKVGLIIRRQFVSALRKVDIIAEREKLDRAVPAIVSAELVSGMVHEMRAQANTAMSKCNAIRRQSDLTSLGKKAQLDFTTIEEAVYAIGDLAKRYLNFDYDNVRQGLEANLEYCSLNVVVDDALFSLDSNIREKNARIERKLNKDLSRRHIYMDRRYFRLALENLIRNSLRWISQGGKVKIETGLRTEFCFARVIDDGPGISPENRSKVFEAFFSRSGGFGLGLTISKYIVERMHKGKLVLVSSEPGQTTFEIRLSLGQS